MKNIAYVLLGFVTLLTVTLIAWGLIALFGSTGGINEKSIFILIIGGIVSIGLIGRVIVVMKDTFKKR